MAEKYQDSLAKANEVADEVISTMRTVSELSLSQQLMQRYEQVKF